MDFFRHFYPLCFNSLCVLNGGSSRATMGGPRNTAFFCNLRLEKIENGTILR